MLGFIREEKAYSQSVMAQKLGVGTKRYRELERERRYPDIDNLQSIYELVPCQPSLFYNLSDRKLTIIKNVWSMLNQKDKESVLKFVEDVSLYI